MVNLFLRSARRAVVDMRVEVNRLHMPGQNHDPIPGDMATKIGLKADVVSQFEVGYIDVARLWMNIDVKQDRTHI